MSEPDGGHLSKNEYGLLGVELLTATMDSPDSTELAGTRIAEILREEGTPGLINYLIGTLNLSMTLLVDLARGTRVSEREYLQDVARRFVE